MTALVAVLIIGTALVLAIAGAEWVERHQRLRPLRRHGRRMDALGRASGWRG